MNRITFLVLLIMPVFMQAQHKKDSSIIKMVGVRLCDLYTHLGHDRVIESKQIIDSLNKLKVNMDFKPTKYKSGFIYYDKKGYKNTLINWVKVGEILGVDVYRWTVKIEIAGVSALAWTDDYWINKDVLK